MELTLHLGGGRRARLRLTLPAADHLAGRAGEPRRPPAARGRLGHPVGRALRRPRRPSLRLLRPGRPGRPARRRPSLHRARLPAGVPRPGRHTPGRLRAGPVDAVESGVRRLGRDPRQRDPLRARGRAGQRLDAGGRRAAATPRALRADAGRPPARLLPADRVRSRPRRVGLRLLEEPRLPRAPRRRPRRLRRLRPSRDPARRDRPRLAVGDQLQHLGVQPPPVPRRPRDDRPAPRGRRQDGRLDDAVGQHRLDRRTDPAPAGVRAPPPPAGSNYAPAAAAGHFVRRPTASRSSPAGGWAPARPSTSPARRPRSGGASRPRGSCGSGSPGSRPTTARATTSPTTSASPTAARAPQAAWASGGMYRCSMQRALDEVHPGEGMLFGRVRVVGSAGDRNDLGRRSGVRLVVAARARRRDPRRRGAAGSRTGRTMSAATSATVCRPLPAGAPRPLVPVRCLHAVDARPRPEAAGAVDLRRAGPRHLPVLRHPPRAARPLCPGGRADRRSDRAADHPAALPDRTDR